MNEIYSILALAGIALGAFASTWVGKTKSKEPYDVQQLISSLIISAFAGFSTIQWDGISTQIESIGYVGTFMAYAIGGFALDKGLSKLDSGFFKSRSAKASPGGSGVWGSENTISSINSRIEFLEQEIINSEAELEMFQNNAELEAKWKNIFTMLIKREIRKTKSELNEIKFRKARLIESGWLPA